MPTNLKVVGDHLAQVASEARDQVHFDLFSRSAFNRYYYSVFLTVRTTLDNIGCKPSKPNHTNVREVLSSRVSKNIKQELKKQEKELPAEDINSISNVATTVVNQLTLLLSEAYAVRCTADYSPEMRVVGTSSAREGKLNGCTMETAKLWQLRAEGYTKMIQQAYTRLGII